MQVSTGLHRSTRGGWLRQTLAPCGLALGGCCSSSSLFSAGILRPLA